jgi:RNA polymerase sigma factor (sigma-70 family)
VVENKDTDILKRLAAKESQIIEQLYRDNFPVIRHMILQNKGNEEDVPDIFQEGMYILYQKSMDPGFVLTCQVKTYLYAICRKLWLKSLSKKRGSSIQDIENVDDIGYEEDVSQQMEQQRQFDQMNRAMEKIGEPCRSLLEAFYIHKKPMHEIAAAFNYTNADNAKNQKYKCLVRLKKLFFSEYPGSK